MGRDQEKGDHVGLDLHTEVIYYIRLLELPKQNPTDPTGTWQQEFLCLQFWRLDFKIKVSAGLTAPKAFLCGLQMTSHYVLTKSTCSPCPNPFFLEGQQLHSMGTATHEFW